MAGYTVSNDGDVTGNHGGGGDYWIVKLDSTGNLSWEKSLGGSNPDWAFAIRQTADGGYIVAGESYSDDGDVMGNHKARDFWIVKLGGIAFIDPNINVSPNPVLGNSITVVYCLSGVTAVKFSIMDVLGNCVWYVDGGVESAGEHSRVLEMGNLVNGVYCVCVETKYGVRCAQFVK